MHENRSQMCNLHTSLLYNGGNVCSHLLHSGPGLLREVMAALAAWWTSSILRQSLSTMQASCHVSHHSAQRVTVSSFLQHLAQMVHKYYELRCLVITTSRAVLGVMCQQLMMVVTYNKPATVDVAYSSCQAASSAAHWAPQQPQYTMLTTAASTSRQGFWNLVGAAVILGALLVSTQGQLVTLLQSAACRRKQKAMSAAYEAPGLHPRCQDMTPLHHTVQLLLGVPAPLLDLVCLGTFRMVARHTRPPLKGNLL